MHPNHLCVVLNNFLHRFKKSALQARTRRSFATSDTIVYQASISLNSAFDKVPSIGSIRSSPTPVNCITYIEHASTIQSFLARSATALMFQLWATNACGEQNEESADNSQPWAALAASHCARMGFV